MSPPGVVFEDERLSDEENRNVYGSRLTRFIIKSSGGILKDEKQATYILIVIAVIVVLASIFIVTKSGPDQTVRYVPFEEPVQ